MGESGERRSASSRLDALRGPRSPATPLGSPAFVGAVVSPGTVMPGTYFTASPVVLLGSEIESYPPSFASPPAPPTTVLACLLGTAMAYAGDYMVCRFVEYRWVAEKYSVSTMSGGGSVGVMDCFCTMIPTSLTMTSLNPSCNYGMFQSCEIIYGPTPAGYADLSIGEYSFLSTAFFPDVVANGAMFQYILTCYYNQFNLSRVYLESPFGSPYHDGVLWSWVIGAYGSSCVPFGLFGGTPYPGSDLTCGVTISG
jgi:hypothetical protein